MANNIRAIKIGSQTVDFSFTHSTVTTVNSSYEAIPNPTSAVTTQSIMGTGLLFEIVKLTVTTDWSGSDKSNIQYATKYNFPVTLSARSLYGRYEGQNTDRYVVTYSTSVNVSGNNLVFTSNFTKGKYPSYGGPGSTNNVNITISGQCIVYF